MNNDTQPPMGDVVVMSQPDIRFIRPLGSSLPTMEKRLDSQHTPGTREEASESYVQGDRQQWSMQTQASKSRRRKTPQLTQDEVDALQKLHERNAAQWLDAVRYASRTPSVRAQLAAIVVWDYFFDNPSPHMRDRTVLIQWMREWSMQTCPNPTVLARALVRLGFPPRLALERSRIEA